MNMRVQLIYPSIDLPYQINHGVTSIAAALKSKEHSVNLLHFTKYKKSAILNKVRHYEPDVVAFSICENQWEITKRLALEIKMNCDSEIQILVGGPAPSAHQGFIYETKTIDGICIGEGELAFLELLEGMSEGKDYHATKGFWFNTNGGVIRNSIRGAVEDLDTLPMPDWSIFSRIAVMNYPAFSFSRGCPFSCAYCCAPVFRDLYEGKPIRFKSVGRAIEEIKLFVKHYDPPALYFDDDTFFKSKKWFLEFCQAYAKELRLPFYCNTRPELVTDELCEILKDAGCKQLSIGIESGNPYIRKKIMKRKISDEQIICAFATAKKAGLGTASFNMVGIPEETAEKFRDTIDLNRKVLPGEIQLSTFYPYRGTELGELCYKKGFVVEKGHATYYGEGIVDLPSFHRKEIAKCGSWFHYEIYKDVNYKKAVLELFKGYVRKFPSIYNLLKTTKSFLKKTGLVSDYE